MPPPIIDMADPTIWDDRSLITGFRKQLEEYKRYHSIHASGERVEDVLDQYELEQLQKELRQRQRGSHSNGEEDDGYDEEEEGEAENESFPEDDDEDVAMDISETDHVPSAAANDENSNFVAQDHHASAVSGARKTEKGTDPVDQGEKSVVHPPPYPEALISRVKDEGLKEMMLAWYYAGYYTGLHDGQRKAQEAKTETRES